MPDVSLETKDIPSQTGMPGVGYMQAPQGAMARLKMEKELEKARLRAGVSGMAMAIPGMHGVKTMPGEMDIGANFPVGRGNLDISARRSINPIPGRGHEQGINAQYTMPFAGGGKVGFIEEAATKIPSSVVKAYKLFRTKANKPDELYPLFVNANKPVPVGEWVNAEVGPVAASGKVKSKLGELAYRPGWHAGDLPVATHIGGKSAPGLKAPDFRRPDEVWAEVEMPADVDWQEIANQRARLNKAGQPIPSTAHITDAIPEGGHYRYKTSPNMQGNWLIGGGMKVNKVLTDEEVQAINEAAGVADLPRFTKFDEKAEGGKVGALEMLAKKAIPVIQRQANKAKFLEGTKVVDHNGKPITMYHHTTDFKGDAFNPALAQQHDQGYHAQGMYFGSDDYLKRSAYGKNSSGNAAGQQGFTEGSQVMPVNLSIKNPKYVDVSDQSLYGRPSEELKQQGYDGVIVTKDDSFKNVMGRVVPRQKVYNAVAFEPTQVKSAIGNEGTFDPLDPRLHKKDGGLVGYAEGGLAGAVAGQNPVAPTTAPAYTPMPGSLAEYQAQRGNGPMAAVVDPWAGTTDANGTWVRNADQDAAYAAYAAQQNAANGPTSIYKDANSPAAQGKVWSETTGQWVNPGLNSGAMPSTDISMPVPLPSPNQPYMPIQGVTLPVSNPTSNVSQPVSPAGTGGLSSLATSQPTVPNTTAVPTPFKPTVNFRNPVWQTPTQPQRQMATAQPRAVPRQVAPNANFLRDLLSRRRKSYLR